MLDPTDLPGVDELLALRIIGIARSIAPCLDSLPEGRDRQTAVAILQGIAVEARQRGSRMIKGQRIDTASVDYTASDSWFTADDKSALRAMCGAVTVPGSPVGFFPVAGVVNRLWPEGNYQS